MPNTTDIQYVKGVGPGLGAILKSRGIQTVRDLLYFFPRAYEDRSKMRTVSELLALPEGEKATSSVRVISARRIPLRGGNRFKSRSFFEVRCGDDTGTLGLKWFHAPKGMESRFKEGAQIIVTGAIKLYMGRPEMIHPEIAWGISTDSTSVGRIVPVYTELEGVSTRVLRKVLFAALEKYGSALTEDLPAPLLSKYSLPKLPAAIQAIHFPDENWSPQESEEFSTPSHQRLIYEEFFKFEYLILRQRLRMARESAQAFGQEPGAGGRKAVADLEANLPFKLTNDQKASLNDILKDLAEPHPMNRLVQGDVGSGKTAVALLSAGCILAEGGQVALMAPTEILAEQHFANAIKLFTGRLNVALLTGSTPQSERNKLLPRLAAGEPMLLIGTHALIEEPVVFKNLMLTIIDEQHRFGVEQRRALRKKGVKNFEPPQPRQLPHALVLTATPIPRTLALTAYGDLSVSSIKELPPGRSPIITKVVQERSDRAPTLEKIREELRKGRQAYFIFPLVNDSEAEGFTSLKSAVTEAERFAKDTFKEFRVGLLHGQLNNDEKSDVMNRFKRGEIQVLVSTTVVEVGVDVPNATVMAVEHSERFGLSQLHQLRGRVGRGQHQSYCYLFCNLSSSETTSLRLNVLEETNDGFKIAEADLEIRGPGEFLGVRQAGALPFKLANLVRDRDWLMRAREDAGELLARDPDLMMESHLPLRRYYEREGKLQGERLKTS